LQHTEGLVERVEGVKVEIAGALVSPLGSAPRLLDRLRGRAMLFVQRARCCSAECTTDLDSLQLLPNNMRTTDNKETTTTMARKCRAIPEFQSWGPP
jgi:hypothetical protein